MKLTKTRLKQFIKEELKGFTEGGLGGLAGDMSYIHLDPGEEAIVVLRDGDAEFYQLDRVTDDVIAATPGTKYLVRIVGEATLVPGEGWAAAAQDPGHVARSHAGRSSEEEIAQLEAEEDMYGHVGGGETLGRWSGK